MLDGKKNALSAQQKMVLLHVDDGTPGLTNGAKLTEAAEFILACLDRLILVDFVPGPDDQKAPGPGSGGEEEQCQNEQAAGMSAGTFGRAARGIGHFRQLAGLCGGRVHRADGARQAGNWGFRCKTTVHECIMPLKGVVNKDPWAIPMPFLISRVLFVPGDPG